MSYHAAADPKCVETAGSIELVIEPRERDLGGFSVRRVLPSRERRMVGPFVFFDHVGPADFPPGEGIQVRPHPHIGLATITYLFAGEIFHRDSLGFVQPIQPGAVNLMVAGRGIVHSERAGGDLNTASRLHGIQSWIALPDEQEDCDPAFRHYPAADIPEFDLQGVAVRVIMGSAYEHTSPVMSYSPTLYLECRLPTGSVLPLPASCPELAVYIVSGDVRIEGTTYSSGVMAVACPGTPVDLEACKDSHVMVVGGNAVGARHTWWNFVSSSKHRIETAKVDWKERRFPDMPGESEFIPLPD
jgi:redox-sensitive bicupin YhaK (pirin superfamily)